MAIDVLPLLEEEARKRQKALPDAQVFRAIRRTDLLKLGYTVLKLEGSARGLLTKRPAIPGGVLPLAPRLYSGGPFLLVEPQLKWRSIVMLGLASQIPWPG